MPDKTDLSLFNSALAQAMSKACLVAKDERLVWDWEAKETALDWMLWTVLRSAAELLTSDELHAVKQCANETCSWLFLDTSKNHTRRWCDMKSCGNRAKVGRHYERKRQKKAGQDVTSYGDVL